MKNHNKANACQTQIADISMAGKELSEEHLRLVAGGLEIVGAEFFPLMTKKYYSTCTEYYGGKLGCRSFVEDSYTIIDDFWTR